MPPGGARRGLTLLEIVIAVMLLALIMTGMVNLFVTSKRYLIQSQHRVSASMVVQSVLDGLYSAVRQDTWDSGSLANGASGSQTSGVYTVTWSVSDTGNGLRKVVAVVTWPPVS